MHSAFLALFNTTKHLYKFKRFKQFSLRMYCVDKEPQKSSAVKLTSESGGDNSTKEPDEQILFEYPTPKTYPFTHRTVPQIFKQDIDQYIKYFRDPKNNTFHRQTIPASYEFIIIGTGPVASSLAYWIREMGGSAATVLVIDKDFNRNKFCDNKSLINTTLAKSVGVLKQQYSLEENIKLSLYGAEFLRKVDHYFPVDERAPNTPYKPFGYLTLSSKKSLETLKSIHFDNQKLGVCNELITPYQMTQRFPWLNIDEIALGLHGQLNEGWFDPEQYLMKLRSLAIRNGVLFNDAEPVEFVYDSERETDYVGFMPGHYQPTNELVVKTSNGEYRKFEFGYCIIAAGADTGIFMKEMLHTDKRYQGMFQFEVPITRRKRFVYAFECPNGPPISSPMVIDSTGLFFRRDGPLNTYICGCPPLPHEEPDTDNLDVDPAYFNDRVWPLLANRVPAFQYLKLLSSWATFEEFNTFDDCPIIGQHPAYHNIFIAAGFGERSYLHAPGVGRAFAEGFFNGYYQTIDLNRFSFHRVIQEKPIFEKMII